MNYMRGSKADYSTWEALGNSGLNWYSLQPYFRKGTSFYPPSPHTMNNWNITYDSSLYDHGPLSVSIDNFQWPDLATFWSAWRARAGIPKPVDTSSGDGPGVYWMQNTIDPRDGTRATARKAYYDPVCGRRNLVLLTGFTGREILFEGLRAKGMEIVSRDDGEVSRVFARKEGTKSSQKSLFSVADHRNSDPRSRSNSNPSTSPNKRHRPQIHP